MFKGLARFLKDLFQGKVIKENIQFKISKEEDLEVLEKRLAYNNFSRKPVIELFNDDCHSYLKQTFPTNTFKDEDGYLIIYPKENTFITVTEPLDTCNPNETILPGNYLIYKSIVKVSWYGNFILTLLLIDLSKSTKEDITNIQNILNFGGVFTNFNPETDAEYRAAYTDKQINWYYVTNIIIK